MKRSIKCILSVPGLAVSIVGANLVVGFNSDAADNSPLPQPGQQQAQSALTNGESMSSQQLNQVISEEAIPTDSGDSSANYSKEFLSIAQAKGLDADFVRFSGEGDVGAALLGQLGVQQAQSGQVRQFSEKMLRDNSTAYAQLKPVAKQLTVEVPKATSLVNATAYLRLKDLHGAEFDKQLSLQFVKSYAMAIGETTKAKEFFKTPEAKMLAEEESPVLMQNYKDSVSLAKSVGINDEQIRQSVQEVLQGVGAPGIIGELTGAWTSRNQDVPTLPRGAMATAPNFPMAPAAVPGVEKQR